MDVCTWGVSYCGTHTCGRAIAVLSVCIGILRWRRARVSSRQLSWSNLYFIILHGHLWTESIIATKKKKKLGLCKLLLNVNKKKTMHSRVIIVYYLYNMLINNTMHENGRIEQQQRRLSLEQHHHHTCFILCTYENAINNNNNIQIMFKIFFFL